MINVVHIYPKDNSMIANYVTMLTKSIGDRVNSQIIDDVNKMKELFKSNEPDIIHQHGHISFTIPTEFQSRRVLTLHGEKTPNEKSAYVVIARSEIERKRCNVSRIEIIRNPIITKTVSFDDIAEKTIAVYQKVMNTNVPAIMDNDTRQAMKILMKAGLSGDRHWLEGMTLPTTIDWNKLHVVAYYEHIDLIINRGAKVMGVSIPMSTVTKDTGYLPDHYLIPKETNDIHVIPLLEKIAKGDVCLLRFAELYQALTDQDLDEEELIITLKQKKLISLMQSSLQILKELFYLHEGFMPCKPLVNHETRRLNKLLANHLAL